MKALKEYQSLNKNYIRESGLNSDNIYEHFENENVLLLIRRYYEVYTKFLFNKLMGSLRLTVSKEKAKKLIELKGEGSWEFAGMIDMYHKGAATCELGHPLRYVYKAINTNNGEVLNFGFRCVGDFFDLDPEGVKALAKVKDDMFAELKEMVAIREQNLMEEHYKYDCGELGLIINVLGLKGLENLRNLNSLMPIVIDFVSLGLPLPKSLLSEVVKFNSVFKSKLSDKEFLGIDNRIEELKSSRITLISQMFTYSEQDIYDSMLKGKLDYESDFYNFRKINDINLAVSIWVNRQDRLLKAQDYFKKMGITFAWFDIYDYMIKNRVHNNNSKFYYAVESLMLFDKDIKIESNFYMPKEYSYRGFQLNQNAQVDFDALIDFMATREFFMLLKEVQDSLDEIENKKKEENSRILEMMDYLRSNLLDEKYTGIKGIMGVRDIVCNKKLEYDDMTEKQQNYVVSKYKVMKMLDKEKKKEVFEDEINNRYTLLEKPDILAKIQRLQTEVPNLPDFYIGVLNTVMQYKVVSDKQIIQINNAFSKYILGEETSSEKKNVVLGSNKLGSKKYSLMELPDIKDKIIALQKHPDFTNMPEGVKNILNNILKYNSASEEQIRSVENTYRRYYRGN